MISTVPPESLRDDSDEATHIDQRFDRESGLAGRVADIVEPVLEDLNFRLVRVRVTGANGCTLQIMAERSDGTMTIEDCTEVSRALSAILDVEDPMPGEYHLEISSPGIDRPLVRAIDFERWTGHLAKIELRDMFEGRRRFRGEIIDINDSMVTLSLDQAEVNGSNQIAIELGNIQEARLVLTDALIEQSLKQQVARDESDQT